MPKVTVVVPSFNVAPYIGKCLDSIVNQTLRDIEIFVVDAYSTDGTREIIEEYVRRDERVKLLDDVKGSTGYAKNIAIDLASAPYYAIVESDDYVEKDMLEKLYNVIVRTGADFVKSDFSTFIGDGRDRFDFPKSVSLNSDDYNRVINPRKELQCFKWIMFEWLGLYRIDFLKKFNIRHNETPGAAFQDTGFWFLSFAYARHVYLLKESFYHYRCDNPYASVKDPNKSLNICVEYDYIASNLRANDEVWSAVKTAFYRGYFYDNYIVFCRIVEDLQPALVSVMQKELACYDDEGIDKDFFAPSERKKIELLLESEKQFIENEREIKNRRNEQANKLLNRLEGANHIVIYGAGSYGTNLQYFLKTEGIDIELFVDRNPKLQGNLINSVKVVSIDDVLQNINDAMFLVASKIFANEIRDNLMGKGIDCEKIIICDTENIVKGLI